MAVKRALKLSCCSAIVVSCAVCARPDRAAMDSLAGADVRPLPSGSTEYRVECVGAMDTLVTPSGIGAVRLWMSVSRLVEGCGARDSIPPPGATEQRRILVLGSEASGELIAFSQHGELQLVEGVMTRSSRYRTRAGIGAGATVASLVAAYPESCVQGDDNFVAVAPRGLNGISFDIGVDATALQNSMSSRTLQSLPDTARVSSVRLEGLDLGCEAPWTAMGHGDISQSAFAPSGARTMNDSGGRP